VTFANGEVTEGYFDDIIKSDDESYELIREKKELKTMLILSAVFCVIGLIIGLVGGISNGGSDSILAGIIMGIWFGTGFGGAMSTLNLIPYMFKTTYHEEGCVKAVEGFFKDLAFLIIGFTIAGPIGFLVRFIRKKIKIKNLQ